MNTYGNSAFPMNTYAAESGYYAPGAEFDPLAPFNGAGVMNRQMWTKKVAPDVASSERSPTFVRSTNNNTRQNEH